MHAAFILASRSPRRRALLEHLGFEPILQPPDVDETILAGESPREAAGRLARLKAKAISAHVPVLASDTVVDLEGVPLGKAASRDEARTMLKKLSGKAHWVHTGVAIEGPEPGQVIVSARVSFRPLTTVEVEGYLDTDEPYDKAGAYGVQGLAGAFVDRIEGSYTGIIGLPLREALELLARNGVFPPGPIRNEA